RAIGCRVEEFDDGMKIYGKLPLHGANIDSFGDHRIAMAMSIAGLFLHEGTLIINNTKNIDTSFPDYETYLTTICS
ncbi:3-phosphoshikimate 1-carboxyvinyltransferase, partial [Arthrospira platensis SPKY1]|nr:3-phosphoshikimate 1-carboxyvinyltransferase [Arthrospira platensis SPKY1]